MIDLHCHLLPGIDDGPQSMAEAVALARHAVQSGISGSVVTPHIHHGRYENTQGSIKAAFDLFSCELKALGIPLQLGFGAEVRIGPEIVEMVEENEIPFLGRLEGYRILLLEFPHGHIPLGSEKLVMWLLSRKIRPMIAHPERNKDVLKNVERIRPYVELGCLLQLTAGSVAGLFGPPPMKTASLILERGWAFALATDAHNLEHRPPEMEAGRQAAEKIVGTADSFRLVHENPASLLA